MNDICGLTTSKDGLEEDCVNALLKYGTESFVDLDNNVKVAYN